MARTKKLSNRQKLIIEMVTKFPDARLVKNKYKVMAKMIKKIYPIQVQAISEEMLTRIMFDAINGDREWRKHTKDFDRKEKARLEAKKLLELGYGDY